MQTHYSHHWPIWLAPREWAALCGSSGDLWYSDSRVKVTCPACELLISVASANRIALVHTQEFRAKVNEILASTPPR